MTKNKLIHLKSLIETNPLWYQNEEIAELIKLFTIKKISRKDTSLKYHFKELLISDVGYNWDQ